MSNAIIVNSFMWQFYKADTFFTVLKGSYTVFKEIILLRFRFPRFPGDLRSFFLRVLFSMDVLICGVQPEIGYIFVRCFLIFLWDCHLFWCFLRNTLFSIQSWCFYYLSISIKPRELVKDRKSLILILLGVLNNSSILNLQLLMLAHH